MDQRVVEKKVGNLLIGVAYPKGSRNSSIYHRLLDMAVWAAPRVAGNRKELLITCVEDLGSPEWQEAIRRAGDFAVGYNLLNVLLGLCFPEHGTGAQIYLNCSVEEQLNCASHTLGHELWHLKTLDEEEAEKEGIALANEYLKLLKEENNVGCHQ